MSDPNFWSDRQKAEMVGRQARVLRDQIGAWEQLDSSLSDLIELRTIAAEEKDETTLKEIEVELDVIAAHIADLEFRNMLNDEDDSKNAIIDINSGAGGTESQDWTQILHRMLLRWCERKGFGQNIIYIFSIF